MNTTNAINTYKNVGLESSVLSADPHKLILMLYQGALLAIASAKNQMLRKEIEAKGISISKALRIIDDGLKGSLNMNVGGDLSKNLASLYDYMCQRLIIANLKNDPAVLDEISGLLSELKGAWEAIRPDAQAALGNANQAPSHAVATPATTTSSVTPQSTVGKQAALAYGRM